MASIIESTIDNFIRDELGPGVEDYIGAADYTWTKIDTQMLGVQKDDIGKSWQYTTNIQLSLGGAAHFDTVLEGSEGGGTHAVQRTGIPTYPSPAEYFSSGAIQQKVRLVKMRGNLFLSTVLMEADELSATQANLVAMEIQNAGRHVAQLECNSFYQDQDYLETITGSVTDGGTGDSSVTFTLAEARPRTFFPSMRVEVWDSASTTRRHADGVTLSSASAEVCFVDSYNPSTGVVTLKLSTGTFDTQVAATDLIYPMRPASASGADITASGNKAIRPFNFYSFVKSTGTIYGGEGQPTGIDVDTYGALASITADMGNAPLAEKHLNLHFGNFGDAFDTQVDHAICSGGVLRGYREGRAGLAVEQRQNMEVKTKAGHSYFVWVGAGKSVEFAVSNRIKSNTLVGLKLRDKNFVRLVPPGLKNVARDNRFSGRIEFIAPLGNGGRSIWMFTRDADSNVEARLQAPWHQSYNIFARDPRGVLLTNIQEQ